MFLIVVIMVSGVSVFHLASIIIVRHLTRASLHNTLTTTAHPSILSPTLHAKQYPTLDVCVRASVCVDQLYMVILIRKIIDQRKSLTRLMTQYFFL